MSKRPSVEQMFPGGLPEGAKSLAMAMPGEAPAAPEPARRSKYGAEPTTYNGVRYASKAEAARAAHLDQLEGIGVWYVRQPKFHLGCPENVYVADFLVVGPGDRVHVEDVKGHPTPKFIHDVKLWKAYGRCQLWVIKGRQVEFVNGGLDPVAKLHGTQGQSTIGDWP